MTEIIKNSKSISLDFIDTGASGGKSSEGNPVFESVYSNLDLNSGKAYKKEPNVGEAETEKKDPRVFSSLQVKA